MGASCSACNFVACDDDLETRLLTDGPDGKAAEETPLQATLLSGRSKNGERIEKTPPTAVAQAGADPKTNAPTLPGAVTGASEAAALPDGWDSSATGPEANPLMDDSSFLAPGTPLMKSEPPSPKVDLVDIPQVAQVSAVVEPMPTKWSQLPSVGTWLHLPPRCQSVAPAAPPAALDEVCEVQVPAVQKPFFKLPSVGTWLVPRPHMVVLWADQELTKEVQAAVEQAKESQFALGAETCATHAFNDDVWMTKCDKTEPAAYGIPMPVSWKEHPAVAATWADHMLSTSTISLDVAQLVIEADADGI